jgi:hypothetical protein
MNMHQKMFQEIALSQWKRTIFSWVTNPSCVQIYNPCQCPEVDSSLINRTGTKCWDLHRLN